MDFSTVEVITLTNPSEPAILKPYAANKNEYQLVNAAGMISSSDSLRSGGFEDYLFLYLDDGSVNLNGKIMVTSQAALIKPRTPLSLIPDPGMALTLYWARFTGFGAESILNVCHLPNSTPVNTRAYENAINEFMIMIKESVHTEYCFRISAAARLTTIIVALCGNRFDKTAPAKTEKADSSSENGSKIALSLDFIHDHYSGDISLEMLSDLAGLSVSRYRTIFKERMGSAPLDYIIRLRINKAKELIIDGNMSLREVAESVGYDDPLYFSRLFKKRTGIKPSDYVKEAQKRNGK